MTYYTGKAGLGGMALESTAGTKVTPTIFLPYEDLNDENNPTVVIPKEHRGNLDDAYTAVKTAVDGKVNIKMDAFPEMGLEQLLYGVMGTKNTTGNGTSTPYTHALTQATTAPTFTLWSHIVTADSTMYPRYYTNAMLDSLKISIKEKEAMKIDASFLSNAMQLDSSTTLTPTYSANPDPFVFPDLNFKINDYGSTPAQNTKIQNVEIDIKKSVKQEWIANGSLGAGAQVPTAFELSGKFSLLFEDQAELKKFMGSATATSFSRTVLLRAVTLEFTGKLIPGITPDANYKMTVTMPRVLLNNYKQNYTGDELLKYDFDFRALRDGSTSKTADISIVSKLATIT
jgi:hypothetical protein